ncbi:hypothetical protein [Micromonospora sp. HUAS LYJ1]|uniref:hypothetical protein n=1 Tax=Micromonospora sp. HUAS LYJ1 TaxID=3061626 RepID=UPI0026740D86|nr:hypothetical protein [Micromonospora sp. HUAS LYJ1]WKU07985.1 hypothetical protein Q2K16_13630 [Micromonospora sp. HUAS LYJ1]
MTTTHAYLAIWPITNPSRPPAALIAEASAALDVMAATGGARIVGTPRWVIAGDRLICRASAVPLAALEESAHARRARLEGDVLRLAGLRWSARQIAATTGLPHSTVQSVLTRYRQPAAA